MNRQATSEEKPLLFADYLSDSGRLDFKSPGNGFKSLSRLISIYNISAKSFGQLF